MIYKARPTMSACVHTCTVYIHVLRIPNVVRLYMWIYVTLLCVHVCMHVVNMLLCNAVL